MVAKTGLVVPIRRDESFDRWKSDRSGTQILLIRGFTQTESMRIFYVRYFLKRTIYKKKVNPKEYFSEEPSEKPETIKLILQQTLKFVQNNRHTLRKM